MRCQGLRSRFCCLSACLCCLPLHNNADSNACYMQSPSWWRVELTRRLSIRYTSCQSHSPSGTMAPFAPSLSRRSGHKGHARRGHRTKSSHFWRLSPTSYLDLVAHNLGFSLNPFDKKPKVDRFRGIWPTVHVWRSLHFLWASVMRPRLWPMTLSLKVLSRTCCEIAGFSTFTSSHWVSTPCPLRRRFGRGLSFFSLVLAGVTFSTLKSSFNDLLPSHLTAFQPRLGADNKQ